MSLRHALLGLLTGHPASGYDLLKLFETSLANVWPATQSQIYTELTKLADTGLVIVTAEGPRGRKEYTLTDAGRTELLRWLTEPKQSKPARSDMLLRVFFLGLMTPDQASGYLTALAAKAAADHDEYREIEKAIDWADGNLSIHGRLALEFGLRYASMRREWAEWSIQQIADRELRSP
jgi:PadR family transcriptional regulator, regulatory protein AphA